MGSNSLEGESQGEIFVQPSFRSAKHKFLEGRREKCSEEDAISMFLRLVRILDKSLVECDVDGVAIWGTRQR